MRIVEAFSEQPVRCVAVSADGRFLAAAAGFEVGVIDWMSGEVVVRQNCSLPVSQLAFTSDGNWVLFASAGGLFRLSTTAPTQSSSISSRAFSGGVAVSPDGKTLVATTAGHRQQTQLQRWEVPSWRPISGFDYWSPFHRLAFSPNGEFLAGIGADSFELRIAVTGGLNGRYRVRYLGDGFFTFPRDSQSVVFGWETDLQGMETRAGNVRRRMTSPGSAFRDAAFLGKGRQLATVDGTELMRLWCAEMWTETREFDWGIGRLTCVTTTADGLAGVCGSETGHLIVFDVDE